MILRFYVWLKKKSYNLNPCLNLPSKCWIKHNKQPGLTSAARPGFLQRSSDALRKSRRCVGAAVPLRILQLNGLSAEL